MKTGSGLAALVAVVALGATIAHGGGPRATAAGSRPAADEVGGLAAERGLARKALVERLLKLAAWCNTKELFLERDRVWTQVIAIEPDNLEARKGLRYGRNTDGSWKEPAPREAKNRNDKALQELPARRAEAVGAFRDRMLALLDEHKADRAVRAEVLDEVLAVDPDDEKVRGLLGQAKLEDGTWAMAETASGKRRRGEIRDAIQGALAGAPPAEGTEPNDLERTLVDGWSSALATPSVRVLATVDAAEALKIAAACEASLTAIEAACGVEGRLPEGYTVYALSPGDKDAFVERLGLSDEDRARLAAMPSSGIPGLERVFVSDPDPAKRLDAAVRDVMTRLLSQAFQVSSKQGWVWEGFGLYLTREVAGTRYTWYILASPGADQDSLRGTLLSPTSNWMNEALGLFDGPEPPDLGATMAKDLSEMRIEDMIVSYALAAYLAEGRPQETPALLARIGAGAPPEEAVRAALGLSIPELQDRLTRWLKERR